MSYNILCIDDDNDFLISLRILLKKKYRISTANSLAEGLQIIKNDYTDLVLLDISLNGHEDGLNGLKQIKQLSSDTDVIMVTGARDPKLIVEAIREGATDYICKPFDTDELIAIIEKNKSVKNVKEQNNALVEDLNPVDTRSRILGASPPFIELMEKTGKLKGHTDANVLIMGESGTGKELLARHIHALERKPRRPFIAVNCAAIPEGLIESELFGYERGAFTGANSRKIGKFELANDGDIFLDEISSLKSDLQAKILRVLQEKEIVRVGGNTTIPVTFRVISATNENLTELVSNNRFRIDLYHRLRVIELIIPPLRERKEDIALLTAYFLDKLGKMKGAKRITAGALRRLQQYSWPGNVRELENIIHSLTILSENEIISEEHLPNWMDSTGTNPDTAYKRGQNSIELPEELNSARYREFLQKTEKLLILKALKDNNGDKTRTAEMLKMGRTTLYGKLKELGIYN